MKFLIVASCVLALAAATPGYLGASPLGYSAGYLGASPLAYAAAPAHVAYAAAPVAYSAAAVAPASVSTQHHAQDTLGQYNYGYSDSNSAKQEVRTADGITRGGYSYVDGNGLVQSTSYVSDPINGFRVAATNLPVGPAPVVAAAPVYAAAPAVVGAAIVGPAETPEVIAARAAHFNAHAVAKANLLGRKKRSPGYLGAAIAAPAVAAYAAPAVAAYAAPAVAAYAAPAVTTYAHHGVIAAPAISTYAHHGVIAAPAISSYAHHGVIAAPAISSYAHHGVIAAPAINAYAAHAIAKGHYLA